MTTTPYRMKDADIIRANVDELARRLAGDVIAAVGAFEEDAREPIEVTVRPDGDLVACKTTRPGGHFRLHVDKDDRAIHFAHCYRGRDGTSCWGAPRRAPIRVVYGALAVDDRGTLKTASELLQQWLREFFSTIECMRDRH
jgi:hypothetical protein